MTQKEIEEEQARIAEENRQADRDAAAAELRRVGGNPNLSRGQGTMTNEYWRKVGEDLDAKSSWRLNNPNYDPMQDRGWFSRSADERKLILDRLNQREKLAQERELAKIAMDTEIGKAKATAEIVGAKNDTLENMARIRGQAALDRQAMVNEQRTLDNQSRETVAGQNNQSREKIADRNNQTKRDIAGQNNQARFDLEKYKQMNENERAAADREMRTNVETMRQKGASGRAIVGSILGLAGRGLMMGFGSQVNSMLEGFGVKPEEIKDYLESIKAEEKPAGTSAPQASVWRNRVDPFRV